MKSETLLELNGGYLAEFGATLIDNGYNIVPINAGKKAPILEGWQRLESTKEVLNQWLSKRGGYLETGGVGITTKHTPAIDIDIRDEQIADQMEKFIRDEIGDAPLRVGRAPKRLMLFKTDEPFAKMSSKKYRDQWGDMHQIEILGNGQQFVAYHIHPDTRQPYAWPNQDGPSTTPVGDLINVTKLQCESVLDYFEELAAKQSDWEQVKNSRRAGASAKGELDNVFGNSIKTNLTIEDMRDVLMDISEVDDRDLWIAIGMALHYEYDASEEALALWNEWSSAGLDYDEKDQEYRWSGFSDSNSDKTLLGGAFVIDVRNKEMSQKAEQALPKLKAAFLEVTTVVEWEAAAKAVRKSEITPLQRENIAGIAKKKIDKLMDTPIPIARLRKMLAYESEKNEKLPTWLQGWVYDTENDMYFHTESKMALSKQGFGARFDRNALTKKDRLDGKTSPSASADELALNMYKIEMVHGLRYGPGEPPVFEEDGLRRANTYAESLIPEEPKVLTARDKLNIKRVKAHISHLLADEDEQRMFLDWLSWIVQHPGQRISYATVLQGTQGDGKSFFGQLMRHVMGRPNVRFLSASVLESNFTGWAVGQCLTCIEEIRLLNEDRFKILNQIKDIITNKDISITFKGEDPVTLRNTTSYLLFTNHRNALPLEEGDRRYMVFFSRWQQKHKLLEFMRQNPDYYIKLYGALNESTPALRQWLLGHEQSEGFDPYGHAPATEAHKIMVDNAKPQFIRDVEEVVNERQNPNISDTLFSYADLQIHFGENGYDFPHQKAANEILTRFGYTELGRIRHGEYSKADRFYSKFPEIFRKPGGGERSFNTAKVREYADSVRKAVQPDDDDEL